MAQLHKDVEFAVDDMSGRERIFKSFDEAAGFAVSLAASDGRAHNINILVWSRAGAKALYGSDGVEMYNEDPEASVFERIEVKANSAGRIP